MTKYDFNERPAQPNIVSDAKEKRRKVLEGVSQRRRLTYKRYNLRKIQAYYQHRKIPLNLIDFQSESMAYSPYVGISADTPANIYGVKDRWRQ